MDELRTRFHRIFRIQTALWLGWGLLFGLAGGPAPARAADSPASVQESLKIAVVGDTGIGERAFYPGFLAVMRAIEQQQPEVLLHLGDFVYQPEWLPDTCPSRYLQEIREKLVDPFRIRLFVPGDNDFSPTMKKPKASGCWEGIDPMDTPLDPPPASGPKPGPFEGTKQVGPVLFAVLNAYTGNDPTPWLKPRLEAARDQGLWTIVALHEPAVTTAWFVDKRETVLQQINALKPDLVFAGNQHSYERFHPMGPPRADGFLPVDRQEGGIYQKGTGTIHIVSGGGGATFKPFADWQGIAEHAAPPEVRQALARRALIHHFVLLTVTPDRLVGQTIRVCTGPEEAGNQNPRWRPDRLNWAAFPLECEGQEAGAAEFDRFEIRK